jgi:hypothetical protein
MSILGSVCMKTLGPPVREISTIFETPTGPTALNSKQSGVATINSFTNFHVFLLNNCMGSSYSVPYFLDNMLTQWKIEGQTEV